MIKQYSMKILTLWFLILIPTMTHAQTDKCRYANTVITIEFGDWTIYPATSYVKEGDRVCLIAKSVSSTKYGGSNFRIDNYPVGGVIAPNGERIFSFTVRKMGKNKITCVGTCKDAVAYLEIMSEAEHKKIEDEINKYKSFQNRQPHLIPNSR